MTGRERAALVALWSLLAITALWWTLALWPLPTDSPYWLVRTREVCFGAAPDGMPTRAGWLTLVGEPLAMLGLVLTLWRDAVPGALAALTRSLGGRAVLGAGIMLLVAGSALATARVHTLAAREGPLPQYVPPPASTYPRLDRPAPPLALVDQKGDTVTLATFRGRPVLVAFAYAHCQTVCPALVHDALAARQQLASHPPLLVVTVDPWRDTPSRLGEIASAWNADTDTHVLGGDTAAVVRVLDAWNVPHARDLATGDVAHPNLVYLVDAAGRIAFAAIGQVDAIVALGRRL